MKHAISSVEYLSRMRGFQHGVARLPMDPEREKDGEYQKGYVDGQRARRIYSECTCKQMGLVDSVVVTEDDATTQAIMTGTL